MTTTYQNPILRGMYPDPSIVHVGQYYYMVNSTFEYYPGITLSRSTDLLNWKHLPGIATKKTQADLEKAKSNEGIFAVCIRYHAGTFYVITTNFAEFKTFIITGELNDQNEIVWSDSRINVDVNGIDPDIFFENDHTYVQYTGYIEGGTKALQQVEIDLKTGKILQGPKVISYGTGGRDVEGPHIIKNKGYYYLLAAEGGTGLGHMITIFRSKNLWGPFEACPDNPIFSNRDRADEKLQNIGHGDLFQDKNQNWWLVCLGTRPADVNFKQFTNTGRETMLYPVTWDSDWPTIYNGIPAEKVDLTNYPKHALILNDQRITDFKDSFSTSKLKSDWISLRTSLKNRLTLTDNNLTLTGSDDTLANVGTPSFLALRQTELQQIFVVDLNESNTELNDGQIGIALTIDNQHSVSLMIRKNQNNQFELIKHIQVLDLVIDEVIQTVNSLPQQLKLINTPLEKTFQAHFDSGADCEFKTSANHFSNESINALNTADMMGIYVLGTKTKMSIDQAKRYLIRKEDL